MTKNRLRPSRPTVDHWHVVAVEHGNHGYDLYPFYTHEFAVDQARKLVEWNERHLGKERQYEYDERGRLNVSLASDPECLMSYYPRGWDGVSIQPCQGLDSGCSGDDNVMDPAAMPGLYWSAPDLPLRTAEYLEQWPGERCDDVFWTLRRWDGPTKVRGLRMRMMNLDPWHCVLLRGHDGRHDAGPMTVESMP